MTATECSTLSINGYQSLPFGEHITSKHLMRSGLVTDQSSTLVTRAYFLQQLETYLNK